MTNDLNVIKDLEEICGSENVKADELLKNHTSMKVGGPCKAFVTPCDIATFVALSNYLRKKKLKYYVMGNGSNLVVSDEGYDGIIINLAGRFSEIIVDSDMIYAHAGALLSQVGKTALGADLTGFEFATGIPGTVGGGVFMNAGAYGGELSDVIEYADIYDGVRVMRLSKDELKLSYRRSILTDHPEYICLLAAFALKKGNHEEIDAKIKELAKRRRDKQPLEFPSSGSTFKRPEGDFAGRLIEEASLKGYTVGGMQVSTKHCGFVINTGSGTAKDFIELTDIVRDRVYEKCGVKLELEVRLLGL